MRSGPRDVEVPSERRLLSTPRWRQQWYRHCSPDRLTRGPTIAEGRKWEVVFEKTGSKSARHLGRWVPCKYIQGAASIQVHQLAAVEPEGWSRTGGIVMTTETHRPGRWES